MKRENGGADTVMEVQNTRGINCGVKGLSREKIRTFCTEDLSGASQYQFPEGQEKQPRQLAESRLHPQSYLAYYLHCNL
jgi:hypothetical protein